MERPAAGSSELEAAISPAACFYPLRTLRRPRRPSAANPCAQSAQPKHSVNSERTGVRHVLRRERHLLRHVARGVSEALSRRAVQDLPDSGAIDRDCPGRKSHALRRGEAVGLGLKVHELHDHWRLAVAGDLDDAGCSDFRLCIHRILKSEHRAAIIDLANVGYVDSAGLGILLAMSREYEASDRRMVLVTNAAVDKILALAGITHVFATARTADEADLDLSRVGIPRWAVAEYAPGSTHA